MPAEAQWEYAARAGTRTPWSSGEAERRLREYAWYDKNSDRVTHPVGEKLPNPWGLHDMHGNVWEWCQDGWHDNYEGAPTDGLAWEGGGAGADRVSRGGSWGDGARICRSAYRGRGPPGSRIINLGFRCARAQE